MSAKTTFAGLAAVMALAVAGCESLSAPDTNNPSIESLSENPTRAAVVSATQGMQITSRVNSNGPTGMVSVLGIVGRESYNLDVADPRWVGELLDGPLLATAFGGFMWSAPYRDIRNGNLVLDALEGVPDADMPAAEKEAVRGFVKTLQAYDFLQIINTRDDNGAPVDVGGSVDDPPAPIEDKRAVFDHIVTLLQEASGHLESAGSTFPFELSSGFDGFRTPETFLQFNRALAARVFVYMGGEFGDDAFYDDALTALDNSFIDDGVTSVEGLNTGVYHAFGQGSGDQTNQLFQPGDNPNIRAHSSVRDSAETQTDGETPDARMVRKTRQVDFRTFQGVGSDLGLEVYDGPSAPIPIIRNEELILLRAEANIGLGNLGAAEDDIDLIRDVSGNLPSAGSFANETEALDQLLYEKKYSLLFEGGHHWIDMRRYDRLDDIPLDVESHVVHPQFPFPDGEQRARE
jgi:hypothetical protein